MYLLVQNHIYQTILNVKASLVKKYNLALDCSCSVIWVHEVLPFILCSIFAVWCNIIYCSNGRFLSISCRRMSHIRSKKDNWLLEHQWSASKQRKQTRRFQHSNIKHVLIFKALDIKVYSRYSSTHLPCGSRMLLTPPSLTLIFRQRLESV